MAKRQRSKGTGSLYKRTERGPWIARWFDESGRRREASTGTTDRQAAERILSKKLAGAALRREGVVDVRADVLAQASRVPLSKHLADFIDGVKARGVSDQQAQQLETRIQRVLALARAETIADLTSHTAQMAIGDIRQGDDQHKAMSIQTATHYLRAAKQFTRWMKRDGRVASDPLADMGAVGNPETDRKHVRRAMSDDELDRLIQAAETGPAVRKMRGVDRAMMYQLAAGTGFRANEVRSLTPESFDLDADPPTVRVDAAYSKHRHTDVQPIRPELADVLAPWLKGRPAGKPVFQYKGKAVNLLKADLDAARKAWIGETRSDAEREQREKSLFLQYADGSGAVADFHSLRHLYVSRLVAGGASVKTCQELARHSNPLLTIGRYSHVRLADLTGALESLPCPAPATPEPEQQQARATGTYDALPNAIPDQKVDSCRLYPRHLEGERTRVGANGCDATAENRPENAVSDVCAKKSPGRGNRGHRLAIARSSSHPGRGKPGSW
jgi:site-specific recombinase XerD